VEGQCGVISQIKFHCLASGNNRTAHTDTHEYIKTLPAHTHTWIHFLGANKKKIKVRKRENERVVKVFNSAANFE